MKTQSSWVPRIEALEDRWIPAVLLQLDGSGNLVGIFANGLTTGLSLSFTANDQVNIDEDGNDLGTYDVPGNLTVSVGNTISPLVNVVDLNGFAMSGGLSINLGNSTAVTTLSVLDGTIQGNLNIRTGNGTDDVGLSFLNVNGSAAVNTNGGHDTTLLFSSVIEGNLQVLNTQSYDQLAGTVEGILTFDASRESLVGDVVVDADSVVGGTAVISTGAGTDQVTLGGDFLNHLVVRLGNGANSLDFNATASVLGSTTIVGGTGVDDVDIDGSIFAANMTITLGNGNDDVSMTNAPTVLGSALTIVGGNGADAFRVSAAGLQAPGARLTFLGQNGNDLVDWDNAANIDLFYAYLDGGFGVNNFDSIGTINFPIVIRNFI